MLLGGEPVQVVEGLSEELLTVRLRGAPLRRALVLGEVQRTLIRLPREVEALLGALGVLALEVLLVQVIALDEDEVRARRPRPHGLPLLLRSVLEGDVLTPEVLDVIEALT